MQYVLGNMLNGGGGLNADGLSLDLQFAADKTFSKPSSLAAGETAITSRRGPSATFLRSSAATEVGPDGLIRYAPENLCPRSEEFDQWTRLGMLAPTINAQVSPSGATDSDKIVEDTTTGFHTTWRIFDLGSLSRVTFSIYAKAAERSWINLSCGNGFPSDSNAYFNLSTGVVGNKGAGVDASIQPMGNGWYRCSVSATPTSPTTNGFYASIASANGVNSYTGDGVSGLFVWGAQVERHPTARAYIPTTTAAVYGPRFDHTSAGVCRGLLIEEGRTNFILQSENFASASWVKSDSSISGTLYTAPTGASTANELVEGSLNALHTCSQAAATATIGTTYTFSVFVKRKPSSNQFLLIGATQLVASSFISVNLTNGVTSTGIGSPGDPINVSSTAYPDGWYRVQFSVVATSAAAATLDIRLSRDGTWANRAYLGDGVQSSLVWGAQVEAGSFPTSYIPTTTGSLARSADVCNITGGDFSSFYNQPEGTLFAGVTPQSVAQNSVVVGVNTATYNNSHFIVKGNSAFNANGLRWVGQSFSPLSTIASTLDAANTFAKIAYAYKSGSLAMAYNNILAGTSSTTFTSINPTAMRIGSRDDGISINGHISEVKYFKKRLPDAKIQALTV